MAQHLLEGLKKHFEGDEEMQAEFQAMIDAVGCPKKTKKLCEQYEKKSRLIEEETRRLKKRRREIEKQTQRTVEETRRLLKETRRLKKARSTA